MTVLVTAASNHGATAEIAARISADLARKGIEVELKKPEEVRDIARYDAFVVGSGIYFGQWLKPAKKFIESHEGELSRRPTRLFSSGPIVGDPPTPDPQETAKGDALADAVHAREHKVFPGKLDESKLNWCEKIAVRCAHAREGDYRDWHAIDEWAAAIGRELHQKRDSGLRLGAGGVLPASCAGELRQDAVRMVAALALTH
jgi:menaquinone-dependent protoporphyrinogen oxidase